MPAVFPENTQSLNVTVTPGTKILIINPKNRPKKDSMMVGLLLAWNYKNAIIENEKKYLKNGGKFLIPIPKPILI